MESVSATRTVQRTVRVAVALVVGQALLCAVIGWLTMSDRAASAPAPPTVDRLALPTLAPTSVPDPVPTPARTTTVTTPPTPPPTRATTPAPAAPTSTRRPAPDVPVAPVAPVVPVAPPGTAPPAPPSAPPSSSPSPSSAPPEMPGLVPNAPPSGIPVQQRVTVGDRCWPEFAYGRTADGTLVRCLRTGPHRPRWKIG